jgi:hypothetical protein
MDAHKVNLKKLARDLYQIGLDLGLTPDEAAHLTTTMELPFLGTGTVSKELGGAGCQRLSRDTYQRLHSLVRKLSVG